MMNSPSRREFGFSLLEVIMAVVIISIAASILLFTSRTSATGQERSMVYGDAATATKESLESIQLLSLDSVSRLSNTLMPHSQGAAVDVRASARGLMPADAGSFTGLDTSTLRHITLRTTFKSKTGQGVTKTFTTIVYKP